MLRLGRVRKKTLANGLHWMTRKVLKYRGVEIVIKDPIRWSQCQNEGVLLLGLLGKNNRLHRSNYHVICVVVGVREIFDCV